MSGDAESNPALHTMDFAILGTARSGTTALARLINVDPGCFCGTECFSGAADYATMGMPGAFLGPEISAGNDRNIMLNQTELRRKLGDGPVVAYGNKHPNYFLVMDQLHRQLPDLRSLFIYRDIGEISVSWDRRAANPKDKWPEGRTGLFSLLEWIISISRLAETPWPIRIVDYVALFYTDRLLAKRVIGYLSGREPSTATLERIHNSVFRGGQTEASAPAVSKHDGFLASIGNAGLSSFIHHQGFVSVLDVNEKLREFATASLPLVFQYVADQLAEFGSGAERAVVFQWAGKIAKLFDAPRSSTYLAVRAPMEALIERMCSTGVDTERKQADVILSILHRRLANPGQRAVGPGPGAIRTSSDGKGVAAASGRAGPSARTGGSTTDAAFPTVYEDDGLRITHTEGGHIAAAGPAHVVSFTGIGLGLQGIQTEEFHKTLVAGTVSRATYVIDKRRSWYNATYDGIREFLVPLCASSGRLITLGNSMGGFGAFYFASLLPNCTRAIAFAPQFSVHPELIPPGEKRWAKFREEITEHRRRHALDHPSDDIDYVAFFGDGSKVELEHARRLAKAATARTYIFVVRDCEHDVAAAIKRAGLIVDLLRLLLAGGQLRPRAVIGLLRDGGLTVQRMPTEHDRARRAIRDGGVSGQAASPA